MIIFVYSECARILKAGERLTGNVKSFVVPLSPFPVPRVLLKQLSLRRDGKLVFVFKPTDTETEKPDGFSAGKGFFL